jgi:type II secretory pathway pseudopilin PulG
MGTLIGIVAVVVLIVAAYFIGRNRGKAAVAAENVKLLELQRQLTAALEKGGAWADAEWQQFMTWLKQRYIKL